MTNPLLPWRFHTFDRPLGRFPLLMGIVNVTPDSFSDGGTLRDARAAVSHARQLVEQGADVLDIGGESTRPGAEPVPLKEELRRVIPVIHELAEQVEVPLSIDTTKAEVAQAAIEAGAVIVNDISGLRFDPEMSAVCREGGVGVICMHIQGTPRDMQQNPTYENVVSEIYDYFRERLQTLTEQGIPQERIVLDPGIGFGKTAEHNVQILANIPRFRSLGRPVLIGHSRKRFLGKVLGRTVEERTYGTVGVSLAAVERGADILRLHDIPPTRDALVAFRAICGEENSHAH